jgi:hypothetical protein
MCSILLDNLVSFGVRCWPVIERFLVLSIITYLCDLWFPPPPQVKTFAYSEGTSSWVWWQKPSPCGVELPLNLSSPLTVEIPDSVLWVSPLQKIILHSCKVVWKSKKSTQTVPGGTRHTAYAIYYMKCGRRHLILLLSIALGVQKGWIHFIQCHIMSCCHGFSGNQHIRICAFFISYKDSLYGRSRRLSLR